MPQAQVRCLSCGGTDSPWTKYLLGCIRCERVWHHTCHKPPVSESEKQRLLSDFSSKKSRGLQPKRLDWTCSACTQGNGTAAPGSRLASHPASRDTPIVVVVDDDDIQIVDQPISTTSSSVIGKVSRPRMPSQRGEGVSTSRPSSGNKALGPRKPALQPEIITLSDDDDVEPIQAAVETVSRRRPPGQSLTKGQAAAPDTNASRTQHVLPQTGVTRPAEMDVPQSTVSTNLARPSIQPPVKMEFSAAPSLGGQSGISATPRSESLSASFLAGLSDLSVENNRTAAVNASPIIPKQPQLIYEWIAAKMDHVEISGNTRSSCSATPRRPRKAISTRHITSMATGEPFDFSVDSWKRGKLGDLRRG